MAQVTICNESSADKEDIKQHNCSIKRGVRFDYLLVELGLRVIWYSDYNELPKLLKDLY